MLVAYDRVSPAIDTNYFPNTQSGLYWSSTWPTEYSLSVWFVDFSNSNYGSDFHYFQHYVRLVR